MKLRLCLCAALASLALLAAEQKSDPKAPAKPAPKSNVTYSEAYGKKGEQPKLDPAKDLPRFPALPPAEALKSFKVKKGFRVELAASEPNVLSPIAIAFDENNRMFVVEMLDYSELRDARPHLGRIRMLESTRGDGVFDKATVFADDLPWPTGLICYNGGLFVIASPDILWLKDTKGTGRADERKVVFTGFGSGVTRLNVQALPNCLQWSLDNRIHGATAGNGGVIKQVAANPPQPDVNLNGRDFSFDPRTLTLRAEGPTAQYGMSFDSKGRKFVCSNSDHLQVLMYDARYAGRNPFYAMPSARVSIAEDGPAAEVYRISPDEPWRIIRTRWRISGVVPGMVEGGGRVSGYFTGATGATIYRGDAFGPDFVDNAFIGDAGGNLVHRKKIYPAPDGVGLVARRPDDEKNFEFLASTDTWFRPVLFANAPDGCLYVCDMYREVIEHPWSIPESIKQHIDLNSGNDRGRIWRIAPENFKQPKPAQLGKATTAELVKLLEHPNGWHRDTAARLLYERPKEESLKLLLKLQKESKSPLGRMHALYGLMTSAGLSPSGYYHNNLSFESCVLTALDDRDEIVREHGVKLAEQVPLNSKGMLSSNVEGGFWQLANTDPSVRVRYQLALTLSEFNHWNKGRVLEVLSVHFPTNKWIQSAVMNAIGGEAIGMFASLVGDFTGPRWMSDSKGGILSQLASYIGTRNKPEEVAKAILTIGKFGGSADYPFRLVNLPDTLAVVRALGDGLQRAGSSLAKADPDGKLKPQFAQAARLAADAQTPEATRAEAVQLLGLTSYAESGATLLALLDAAQPQPVQLAALGTLARFTEPTLGGELTKRWANFSSRLKSEALTVVLARPERAGALLAAIEGGAIKPAELGSTQIKQLLNHRDATIRAQAVKLLGNAIASRDSVVKNFMPALQLRGDAAKGKAIYTERCISCHRAGSEGFALGPDLVTVKSTGAEKLLVNILDPNREVAPQYIAFTVETKDDESLVGLIANETTTHVTIRMAFGMEKTLPRTAIRGMKSSGTSLMPEGLEQNLTPQGLADLIEFISTLK